MKPSTKRYLIIGAVLIAIIIIFAVAFSLLGPEEVPYLNNDSTSLTLEGLYKSGQVAQFHVEGNYRVSILIKGEKNYTYFAHISSRDMFEETLARWQSEMIESAGVAPTVTVEYNNPSSIASITSIITPIILVVGGGILLFFILRKSADANNRAVDFGKAKANKVQNSKVRFGDVAGAEEEKQELQEIVDFLKNPQKFTEIGARVPKGVLLVGPPGTGKTLFAKAVAGEASAPFFSISGSDFVEMFVGAGAARVRDLFEQAKKNMPCIVFIDEIDAVGRQRGAGLGGGNDEREQTLNQLLVQMDGFESNDSIIIMAATNRADILDPALMRPGRFDRQIYVNVPDVKGREDIMKVHSRNKPIGSDINFKDVARLTVGFTGADIENMLNEAAILAARDNRKVINMPDISEAINRVIAGPSKKSRIVTETDKRITAYHESGHAIVARKVKFAEKVHEVSIIPRGHAAGYTVSLPDNDNNHATRQQLLDEIAILLAGRAAEEIVIKDITTGASSDIKRASNLARKMVAEWGLSDTIGNMYLGSSEEVFLGRDYQTQLSYSDEMAAKIDVEVKKIIDEQYQVALNILKDNRKVMDAMVKLLYEKETVYANEIDALFAEQEAPAVEVTETTEAEVVAHETTAEDVKE